LEAAQIDVNRFLMEQGRLPHVGDEIPPWKYRGLLLYYAQLGHAVCAETGHRWPWWMSVLETGVLPGPIPKVHFGSRAVGQSLSAPLKQIQNALNVIDQEYGSWQGFEYFIGWLAFLLGVSREPSTLSEKTQDRLYRSFDLGPFLREPGDHIGEFLAATKAGGWNPHAFFPTPHDLVEMMIQVTLGPDVLDGDDMRFRSVYDPAMGTGRMLLHASNYSLRLYGQDIDRLVHLICLINAALYVPWMAFPVPEAQWQDIAAATLGGESRIARQLRLMREVLELEHEVMEEDQIGQLLPAPPASDPSPIILDSRGQGLLFGAEIPSFALYAATANISVTLALTLVVWSIYHIEGVRAKGFIGYLKSWIPAGVEGPAVVPIFIIEVISHFVRIISLSVRLFANILAGHLLILFMGGGLVVLLGLAWIGPISLIAAIVFFLFEVVLIATLQAFIFATLTAIYIGGAVGESH